MDFDIGEISPTAAVMAGMAGLVATFVNQSAGGVMKVMTLLTTTVVSYFIFARVYGD